MLSTRGIKPVLFEYEDDTICAGCRTHANEVQNMDEKARYYWRAVNMKHGLGVGLEKPEEDEWGRDIKEIEAIKSNTPNLSLSQLREKVIDVAIEAVLDAKQDLHLLQSQPQPRE